MGHSSSEQLPSARPPEFGTSAAVIDPQADPSLDLSSCDREPIHIPGSIQPHGFLLAVDGEGIVQVASGTAADFLGSPLASIFGMDLQQLFGQATRDALLAGLLEAPLTTATRLLVHVAAGPERFEVIAHRPANTAPPLTILEFEQSREPVNVEALNARLYNFVAAVRRTGTVEEVCQAAVEEIRALTRCDRVVLYRFDEKGHGIVLAEQLAEDRFQSYLGLRFPASDVPVQARRMYELNRVRIIPNVDYEPSPLYIAGLDAEDASLQVAPEIDLSSSILRSVSPIHRQYMRNMGTLCSMSVSIIIEGALWGLVSCHHHAPRYVPFRLRSACDFTMQIVASQIESNLQRLRLRRALDARAVQGRLLASMAGEENYMDGLLRSPGLLEELVAAQGVAIITGVQARLFGTTPSEAQVLNLVEWLRTRGDEVFATSSLSTIYEEGAAFQSEGSGMLAISVSKLHSTLVLWFRPEVVETVRWAGNPQKPAEAPTPSSTLPAGIVHPRHSFESWAQTVRGTSEPWTVEEVEAAGEFRSAVLEVVLRRAEEVAELATGLQAANEELEAFSYSVSHDLRAPFRHISGFSEMLKEEEASRMSERGKRYLATIMESARFAGLLVDSLLDFSRYARSSVTIGPVNMEELFDREWAAAMEDESRGRAIEYTRTALPAVSADQQLLRQVVRNLLSNAIKYTGKRADARVYVSAIQQEAAATQSGEEFIFSIADNGAGFDQQYAGKLFGVFQRLHRMEEFEGTGIGLANVRRIINRHGGRVWAEGEVGHGATFYFSLPVTTIDHGEQA